MSKIALSDFVPPIVARVARHIFKRSTLIEAAKPQRIHPFDSVPLSIDASWVLDVGANRGDVALSALNSYPNAHVICFEPVADTFKELSHRLASFSQRAHLFNYALGENECEREINITTFNGANSILPQSKLHQILNPGVREIGTELIHIVRLDDIASRFPSSKIDILKIDVEGYELNVIQGGYEFISRNVDVIIIEIALMRDSTWEEQSVFSIFSILNKAGFRLINIIDVNPVSAQDLLLAQMDCVFRHKRNLSRP